MPVALGRQGARSSAVGFGGMSVGIVMPSGYDLYGKDKVSRDDVTDLVELMVKEGVNHLDTAQGCTWPKGAPRPRAPRHRPRGCAAARPSPQTSRSSP